MYLLDLCTQKLRNLQDKVDKLSSENTQLKVHGVYGVVLLHGLGSLRYILCGLRSKIVMD